MNLTTAAGVLQRLLHSEEDSSVNERQLNAISRDDIAIISAENLSANGEVFWQAIADANISINTLSRYEENVSRILHVGLLFPIKYPPIASMECRSLLSVVGSNDHTQAWNAAAALTSLLAIPGAPLSFFFLHNYILAATALFNDAEHSCRSL